MQLYIYRGLENEKVPGDVTHVMVDNIVTVIRKKAFYNCRHNVSVIMGDNVKIIEGGAFYCCIALRFVRLSKTLEYMGYNAFYHCDSLEALFLPSTVKSIENGAFCNCRSLRLMILPNDINLANVGVIIDYTGTAIYQIAENAGVAYRDDDINDESRRRVTEWLFHHIPQSLLQLFHHNQTPQCLPQSTRQRSSFSY